MTINLVAPTLMHALLSPRWTTALLAWLC